MIRVHQWPEAIMYPFDIKSSPAWSQYFEGTSFHDAVRVNNALLKDRVQANASDLFTTDEDEDLHIRITDLPHVGMLTP